MRHLILAAVTLLAACTTAGAPIERSEAPAARQVAPILAGADARDDSSFARPEVARVTHVALDLGCRRVNRPLRLHIGVKFIAQFDLARAREIGAVLGA